MNVQILFISFFYFFSSDFASMLGVVVCTVYGLMAGLRSVQAFPVVDFVPILVGLSPLRICPTHCPLHTVIIVMQLLKDNLVVTNKTIWEVPTQRMNEIWQKVTKKVPQKVSTATYNIAIGV